MTPEMERRLELALYALNRTQAKIEEIDDRVSILEYALSILSRRVDELG